jgi:retinol dehydrogenase-12
LIHPCVAEVKDETGYTAELWIVDLADFASVRRFGDKFDKDGGRLDILVENAGVSTEKYESTKDGWESTLVLSFSVHAKRS